jgi:RNA polymerase sigma factor (sigma-70 family)
MEGPGQERVLRLPLVWGREKPRPDEMALVRADESAHAQTEPTDEELLARVAAGDKEAFALLFDRYAQLLYRVVYRVVDDHGEAEELVQEVFLRLFERAVQFDPAKGTAKPWMVRVAYNRALDRRTYLARRRFRAIGKTGTEGTGEGGKRFRLLHQEQTRRSITMRQSQWQRCLRTSGGYGQRPVVCDD